MSRRNLGARLVLTTAAVGALLVLYANPVMLPAYLVSTAPEVCEVIMEAVR